MIGWWPGDGNAHDISGNGNNGTLTNGTTFGTGEVAEAFNFDGVNDIVTADGSGRLNITGDQMTTDAWIYPRTNTSGAFYFGKSALSDHPYVMYNNSGKIFVIISTATGDNQEFDTGYIPVVNTWTHVAMVYDGRVGGDGLKVLVNGVQVFITATPAGNMRSSTIPFGIGNRATDPGVSFNGLIDEVEVFDAALTQSQIAAIYNAGSAGKCRSCVTPPANMVSWWPGDGHANDIQGTHHGTLLNGATYAAGKVGKAFSFDGADAVDQVADDPAWDFPGNDFTIDTWVKFNAVTGTDVFVAHDDGPGGNNKWIFWLNAGSLQFHRNNPGSTIPSVSSDATFTPTVGRWYHVALTRSGSTWRFFVDGVQNGNDQSDSDPVPDASAPLTLGKAEAIPSLNGLLDEVEIFNRGLSPGEIAAIADAGNAGKCKPPPNEPPVATDDVLSDIAEDSGTRVIAFSALLSNDTAPASEPNQTLTIIGVANPVGGSVQINGTNVEFTPATDFNGPASFDYTVQDNGRTDGLNDFKTDTGHVTFNVTGVNDPPSFTKGADQTVIEDAGAQTINGWATNISQGPGESGQTLTFNVSATPTSGNLTFASGPAIDATTGDLTYTTGLDTNGTATVNVTLSDNGSNVAPNSNTSAVQTFTITVSAVNDAPAAVADALTNIAEDSGTRTIPFGDLIANDSAGPAEESGTQTLIVKSVSNPVGGTVSISGSNVLFTPANNFNGAASFSYTVEDNGTTNGASDPKESGTASVTFTITEVNDAPVAVNDTLSNVAEDSGQRIIPFSDLTANDNKGAANESAQTLTVWSVSNAVGGTVVLDSANSRVLFTPTADFYGPASFDYTIQDDGTTDGSPDPRISAAATASFTVTAVADTPTVTNATTNEDTQSTTGLVIDKNAADGAEVTYFKITNITNGTLYKNDGTTVITEGSLITYVEGHAGLKFTPAANSFANGSFQVQAATDSSGGGLSSGAATATITVSPVADTPSVYERGNS
jgi:hypothetical protein